MYWNTKKNEILLDKKTTILKALHFVSPVASHYWFLEIQWDFFYSILLFYLIYFIVSNFGLHTTNTLNTYIYINV